MSNTDVSAMRQRLEELQRELDNGRAALRQLEVRRVNLESTTLRISGAIQVLEELLERNGASEERADDSAVEQGVAEPTAAA